ncbi:TIGR01777 family oxidoreductase [Rhodopirellula sallentina]|uniref:Nucleoside-diphosphate sugar epimerase n=1 Tax=Rhodopirellula sallentina SM41 TaxID=1263870 RepID=M5UAG5_9BACT|nr:TIGR01777 family oxidoreductase [Rhodopirellula sallentina]EMI58289.1 nucleoside-diphosphate sugar epimerase [Rhodopirellula sallentina SM41]
MDCSWWGVMRRLSVGHLSVDAGEQCGGIFTYEAGILDNSTDSTGETPSPGGAPSSHGVNGAETVGVETPADVSHYVASVDLPVSVEDAFSYHERPGCLGRLVPPWESVEIEHSDNSLAVGSRVVLKAGLLGVPLRWHARHTRYEPPTLFADVQDSGPFAFWHHQHRFVGTAPGASRLTDDVAYQVPMSGVGELFGGSMVRRKLESMFAYRHRVTRDDMALMAKYPGTPKTVAVSGATGLVGSALCNLLTLLGHKVYKITRSDQAGEGEIAAWSSDEEFEKFNEVDVVVHLAGKSIASKRWTDDVKQEIRDSRVLKTRELSERLAKLSSRPETLICASATGFYGNRGDEMLSESSKPGDDFLAGVSQEWEDSCQAASDVGIRVVNTRFGIVLSPKGGALEQMLLPAKLCGGALGNGRQYWSWIALDDVLGAIVHCIHTDSVLGPVNFVSPTPMTNREFAKTLGRVLGRPALFPAPAPVLRVAIGEMADALLLASIRVIPEQLQSSGYEFRFRSLDDVLRYSLGKARLESGDR